MSKPSTHSSIFASLRSLGLPLIIGLSLYVGFYLLIKQGQLANDFFIRYFASHIVSKVVTAMFFVGFAGLAVKAIDVIFQYLAIDHVALDEPIEGQTAEDAEQLLGQLDEHSLPLKSSYLWRRLRDALQFVFRKQSIDGLDDELKYLADLDGSRQQDSYSLVRIMIWAIPMLGFLGTVVGITMALENFGSLDLENLDSAMKVLLSGLYIAFDTTALALSLSVVLMFGVFLIDRFETQLLESVDARAAHQVVGRFEEVGGGSDPHVRSIERMGRAVIEATERTVERQSQLWEATIEAAHQRWSSLSSDSTQHSQAAVAAALDQVLGHHVQQMQSISQASADALQQQSQGWQTAFAANAQAMLEQQKELTRQGDIMKQVVQTTGDVINLETLLNENLKSLAGAKNFEDTVMSLSAAIHLLSTRLSHTGETAKRVDLTDDNKGRAA